MIEIISSKIKNNCLEGYTYHVIPIEATQLSKISDENLVEIFWHANYLSFEDKQKLVTYLNARGHNLRLYKGQMREKLHYTTHYFDGESWKDYKPSYEII